MHLHTNYVEKVYLISDVYNNSVIYDVTTGEEIEFTPNEYIKLSAEKEIQTDSYRKDWKIANQQRHS